MTDPQEKTPPEFDPNRFAATRRLNPEESGLLPPNDESAPSSQTACALSAPPRRRFTPNQDNCPSRSASTKST